MQTVSRIFPAAVVMAAGLLWTTVAAGAAAGAIQSFSSHSLPRVTIAGLGIITADGSRHDPGNSSAARGQVDFSDTELLTQFDSESKSGVHAGMQLGLEFPDRDVNLGQVFYHQVNVFAEAEHWGLRIGRTLTPNTLVAFPTLRDDDQIDYVYARNGFSNSAATEYSQFGDVLRGDLYFFSDKLRLSGFAVHNIETGNSPIDANDPAVNNDFRINSGGAQINYQLPKSVQYEGWIRQLGAGLYHQQLGAGNYRDQFIPNADSGMNAYLAGGVLNLNRNPYNHVDLRLQAIVNQGAGVASVSDVQNQALSKSQAYVASVRFLNIPYQVPRFQLALTGAYQHYSDVNASRWSIIPTAVYNLGNNLDLLVQYEYQHNQGQLAQAVNGRTRGLQNQQTIQVGLVYRFQLRFNDYIGDRSDILNREHGYIP